MKTRFDENPLHQFKFLSLANFILKQKKLLEQKWNVKFWNFSESDEEENPDEADDDDEKDDEDDDDERTGSSGIRGEGLDGQVGFLVQHFKTFLAHLHIRTFTNSNDGFLCLPIKIRSEWTCLDVACSCVQNYSFKLQNKFFSTDVLLILRRLEGVKI